MKKDIINALQRGEMTVDGVPEEFSMDSDIIRAERKLGLRKKGRRGFDVLANQFFVEEEWLTNNVYGEKAYEAHKTTFDSFKEYYNFLNGGIRESACYYQYPFEDDFSKGLTVDIQKLKDMKSFVTETIEDHSDERNKLPANVEAKRILKKKYFDGKFQVIQLWVDKSLKVIAHQEYEFLYFFDFVAFLKGDLSEADLLGCDGLKNIYSIEDLNLAGAKLSSDVCEQFNIPYKTYDYDKKLVGEFSSVIQNEAQTSTALSIAREEEHLLEHIDNGEMPINYISDLHLLHRIENAGCKSDDDVTLLLRRIAGRIASESHGVALIGGDIASDYVLFERFIGILHRISNRYLMKRKFVFVLGNHELWSFPGISLEEIVAKYRKLLEGHGMYLLNNDLLSIRYGGRMEVVPYEFLVHSDTEVIAGKLRSSIAVVLGGTGFSGYNTEFNADDGIYRGALDREAEIEETRKFECLYNKLVEVLQHENTIIFTHTPKKDWSYDRKHHDGFVYVSGHSHRNVFFDDGLERVYADNQIGYKNENPHMKSFWIDRKYDCFKDYPDGIHDISAQEYRDFAIGKNIHMTYNRKGKIKMLKKDDYYCFLYVTASGGLSILNGGALKGLERKDIQYYYENMGAVIDFINKPLREYTAMQETVAKEIKSIGGSGTIHGCIIDIDFYNHVYVNPLDMSVTGYWARDMEYKLVYPDVAALLKAQCPLLHANYLKQLASESASTLVPKENSKQLSMLPKEYLAKDIYKVSREIKKMQKLHANVLTVWYDVLTDSNRLPEKRQKLIGSGEC